SGSTTGRPTTAGRGLTGTSSTLWATRSNGGPSSFRSAGCSRRNSDRLAPDRGFEHRSAEPGQRRGGQPEARGDGDFDGAGGGGTLAITRVTVVPGSTSEPAVGTVS